MLMNDPFVNASRMKLRFNTKQGPLTVEDLWDLPLLTTQQNKACLDDIAMDLHTKLEKSATSSFVKDEVKKDPALQVAFDCVIYVITVKKDEAKTAAAKRTRAENRQKLMGIIEAKENENLLKKDISELRAMLNEEE